MIIPQELRKLSRYSGLSLDMVEKDYVLGWILFGVASSSISNRLVFKGGTSLSKVYFPGRWRLSEDLDFTVTGEPEWEEFSDVIKNEVPRIVTSKSGIQVQVKRAPHTNPDYLQSKPQYVGPIGSGRIKIEISMEGEIGPVETKQVPRFFDYPKFEVNVYSLENILAEKLRSLIQRGKVRDYYDVWKILREEKIKTKVKDLFLQKCKSKGVKFEEIDQFFPRGIEATLKPHLPNLTRLTREDIDINQITSELKRTIPKVL